MTRYEAFKIARKFMQGYQPPVTCAHRFTRWFGLILRWRICEDCRWVEGSLRAY
jgi:hypothetical protein